MRWAKVDVSPPYEMKVLEVALWAMQRIMQLEVDKLRGPGGSAESAIKALLFTVRTLVARNCNFG